MVISRESGEIASWWYEMSRAVDLAATERQELYPLLKMLGASAAVLEKSGLLFADTIVFEDWVKFDKGEQKISRVNKSAIYLDSIKNWGVSDFPELILAYLDKEFEHCEFLYPLEIKVLGYGNIIDKDGNATKWKNVIWINGITFGTHVIEVCTQSFAWMPYDLSGNKQDKIHKYNAPRLEDILSKMSHILGVTPINEPNSDYAIIEDYRVLNRVEVDGKPLQITFD